MEEIFKDIEGYEKMYQISNLGTVKSLDRISVDGRKLKGVVLKKATSLGYFYVNLTKNGIGVKFRIHKLVAIHFLNHIPCKYDVVVNHKDFNRKNNHVDNLELISARDNTNQKHLPSVSKYVRVVWHKKNNKWQSQIFINGKRKYLGQFENEYEAHLAYQNALKNT